MFHFNVLDDDVDYLNCIFNMIKGNTINPCHIKNAHKLKLFSKLNPVDSDIDPNKNDNYYCDREFNDFISLSNVSRRLSILHLNICNLNKNMDSMLMLLQMLKHKFSVIALSETWETATNTYILQIMNYTMVSHYRNTGKGRSCSVCRK